jgi:phosphoribosylanthranilate isomerase
MAIIRIKICGITQYEDAKTAVGLGVDALGFIFYTKSPRYIHPAAARDIICKLPPFVSRVGVFVNESAENIRSIMARTGIDTVQLHADETPEFAAALSCPVVKAFGVKPGFDLSVLARFRVNGYLLDTWSESRGGSGAVFDWSIARRAVQLRSNIILAGGLNPGNVREALDNVKPYAVEFNSGVEIRPGFKNHYKMREAVEAVRAWK